MLHLAFLGEFERPTRFYRLFCSSLDLNGKTLTRLGERAGMDSYFGLLAVFAARRILLGQPRLRALDARLDRLIASVEPLPEGVFALVVDTCALPPFPAFLYDFDDLEDAGFEEAGGWMIATAVLSLRSGPVAS